MEAAMKWICANPVRLRNGKKCKANHWYLPAGGCRRCGYHKLTRLIKCPYCHKTIWYSKAAETLVGLTFDQDAELPPQKLQCPKCEKILELRFVVDFTVAKVKEQDALDKAEKRANRRAALLDD
jgi:uncharacterized protein YbaR (Trm112 family)